MLGHDVLECVAVNLTGQEHLLGQRGCRSTYHLKRAVGSRCGREVCGDGVRIGHFECRHHQGSRLLARRVLVVGQLDDDVALEDSDVSPHVHDKLHDCGQASAGIFQDRWGCRQIQLVDPFGGFATSLHDLHKAILLKSADMSQLLGHLSVGLGQSLSVLN